MTERKKYHGGHERLGSDLVCSRGLWLSWIILAAPIIARRNLWSCIACSALITRQWFKSFLITSPNGFLMAGHLMMNWFIARPLSRCSAVCHAAAKFSFCFQFSLFKCIRASAIGAESCVTHKIAVWIFTFKTSEEEKPTRKWRFWLWKRLNELRRCITLK